MTIGITTLITNLADKKEYYNYAVKVIASRMFEEGYYEQSLKFIEQSNVNYHKDPRITLFSHLFLCSAKYLG
jgi:hypothetical protein